MRSTKCRGVFLFLDIMTRYLARRDFNACFSLTRNRLIIYYMLVEKMNYEYCLKTPFFLVLSNLKHFCLKQVKMAFFSAIFRIHATLRQNQTFSQHRGQQILTKIFSPKQAHKTEQKTYLHFFYNWHGSFANSIFRIFTLRFPFKRVTFIIMTHVILQLSCKN